MYGKDHLLGTYEKRCKQVLTSKLRFCIFLHFTDHETPIDLGILIDASDSVTKYNWPSMLEFASTVVESFDISPIGTHIGLIVFSEDAEVVLYFNTLKGNNLTAENVTKVVNNLRYKEGWSRLDIAMLLAEEELFNEATGMRSEIPKVKQMFLYKMGITKRKTFA